MKTAKPMMSALCVAVLMHAGLAAAQNGAPVRTVKYKAFIESDYGIEITLKPDGKAIYYYFDFDEKGKKQGGNIPGTWSQDGDKVTMTFNYRKGTKTMVYQVKAQNNDPSFKCKGPYGLAPISETGIPELEGGHYLWPANLLKQNGPCI